MVFVKVFSHDQRSYEKIRNRVPLMVVKLQSTLCLVEVTQISACLFNLALEILFLLIETKLEIIGLTIFDQS